MGSLGWLPDLAGLDPAARSIHVRGVIALPPSIQATIDAMPQDMRASFLAAVDPLTSPAQLASIAHHLERGIAGAALYVALAPSIIYAAQDAEIRFYFAWGRIQRG